MAQKTQEIIIKTELLPLLNSKDQADTLISDAVKLQPKNAQLSWRRTK